MYDYYIPEQYRDENRYFYIRHKVDKRWKDSKNVFYLTPLGKPRYIYADVLPWSGSPKKTATIPTYIVSGSHDRKSWELLKPVLDSETLRDVPFKIKVVGYGVNDISLIDKRLIIQEGLLFEEYHKQFLDCYAMLPLVSKEKQPSYYEDQLTSSIHYAKAYKLKTLIDKDLQNIYNLEDVEIYDGSDNFVKAFHKTLKDFYNK